MKARQYIFWGMMSLCVSAALFAAAPRDRAAIEADIAQVQALVKAGDFGLLPQLDDLRYELAVLGQRRVADGRLYLTQSEDDERLRELNYLTDYNELNRARTADNLAYLMSQGSRAQFIQLRSFRQAKELCGFAALANLYAINQLVAEGRPITSENVRDRAQIILDGFISKQPRFQELAARNQYAEAESLDLMNVAHAIGFHEPLFFLSIFGHGAATTQGFFRGVPTALFEERARSQDGMPYVVPYSYKGPQRENLRDPFVLTDNRSADKEPEEIVFENVITSLRTQPTTHFIVNSDRGHYCAICVVRSADGSYTVYYLDSVNSPIKENDFNLLNTVLWVDRLIQRAQQGAGGWAVSAAAETSAAVSLEQQIADTRNLIEQLNNIIKRAHNDEEQVGVLADALHERDLQIDTLNRLLQSGISDDFSQVAAGPAEDAIDRAHNFVVGHRAEIAQLEGRYREVALNLIQEISETEKFPAALRSDADVQARIAKVQQALEKILVMKK